jgi:heme exporter protein A
MALSVDGLTVDRGGRLLFRDLSFRVEPGEILSVYGRNGSGKTSLLRVLAGLLEPLAGITRYLPSPHRGEGGPKDRMSGNEPALSPSPGAARHPLPLAGAREGLDDTAHFCGHLDAVKPAMTVRETLAFWAALYGGPKDGVAKALEDWSLKSLADLPGQYLSAGQKRRVALSRLSLAFRPIWLLDEPSAALDATAKALLLERGEAHCARGGMIVVASHEPLWPTARVLNLDTATRAVA